MIIFYTDFGWEGPYVGQMKAVLHTLTPDEPVIDLLHDAPRFNIKAAAYLLASLIHSFPKGTLFLSVIDPGVGGERAACVIQADDYWFVGPDNGLFNVVLNQACKKAKWNITWRPEKISSTFHGRDLFAPIAAEIAKGNIENNEKITGSKLESNSWPDDLKEIIYIDHYGNCMTGIRKQAINQDDIVTIKRVQLKYADTFSEVKPGEPFWMINSNGLCEIAVNQGNAKNMLGLTIGDQVEY